MAARKKPEGKQWEMFVASWQANNHEGKVCLAETYGVTYDTAKHWISETGNGQVKAEPPKMYVTVDELLGSRPAVNLDFVCFDLETSNLNADFSIVLSAAIKPFGQPSIVFRADSYKEWYTERANDKAIVADIAQELARHAVVVAHFGSGFDIPFLRAKMVKHNLPPLPPMFGIDSWRIARQNFKVSSRRLKNLGDFFDIGEKEPVEGGLWMDAAYNGSKEAMDAIVQHNIQDVILLEKLACLSFMYLKSIPRL